MIRSRRAAALALAALVNGVLPISASRAQKQSTFPSASVPFSGAEVFPLIQGGQNRKTTWATLAQQATGILPFGYPVNARQITGASGLKCDNSTNDTAALIAIWNFWNSSSGADIVMPPGQCLYNASSLPRITAKGGGLVCQGPSAGVLGPAPQQPVGTVFRNMETTSSDMAFTTANYTFIKDCAFYPVNHKTGGCGTEVSNNNKTSASGSFIHFDTIFYYYPYYGFCDHGGTYNRYTFPQVYNAYGSDGWNWISGGSGSSAVGGGGIFIDKCIGYSVDPAGVGNLPQPGAAYIKGGGTAYVAASTSMSKGDFVLDTTSTPNPVLEVTTAGVTANGGTGPSLPTWTTPTSISASDTMTDGTVKYAFYQFATTPYLHVDSNTDALRAVGCKVTQTGKFMTIDNALNPAGQPPKQINVDHEEGNSFWTAGIDVQAGGWNSFRNMDLFGIVAGPAIKVGTATIGSDQISGIFQACLGPCIDILDNHVAASNNGETISSAIVRGNSIAGGGAPLRIANAGTVVGPGSYGVGGFNTNAVDKYGIEFASTATDYHVAPAARVKGTTTDFNNLSTNDGEGVPIAWTPDLKFGGSNTGITYSSRVGSYIRYGKQVLLHFTMNLTSKGAQTGTATITGFPLTIGANNAPLIVQGASNLSGVGAGIGGILSGATISPQTWGATGLTGLADTNFTNTGNLLGTVTGILP